MSYRYWENPFTYTPPDFDSRVNKDTEDFADWDAYYCNHEWKPVLLLRTTVYDCSRCGAKKEELEKK